VGSGVPHSLALRTEDHVVECGGGLTDADLPVLDTLVGQLLGFHRCLEEGLKPDTPSTEGVINRVVESFTIHRRS
jgi:tagatose-6-phosphate ketose/aldose isomerase